VDLDKATGVGGSFDGLDVVVCRVERPARGATLAVGLAVACGPLASRGRAEPAAVVNVTLSRCFLMMHDDL
jgi:hypothetical protein